MATQTTIIDSRVSRGTLELTAKGSTAVDFACQVTSAAIVPSVEDGDQIETLCGSKASTAAKTSDSLEVTFISDWSSATGFQAFSWKNRGSEVSFRLVLADGGEAWTGKIIMKAVKIGGEVGSQVTVDESFPIVYLTPPAAFGDGALHTTPPATKGAAAPGDVFAAESTVTLSDVANAGKLTGLGYVAAPTTAWKAGEGISVGGLLFHWDATKWAPGKAS